MEAQEMSLALDFYKQIEAIVKNNIEIAVKTQPKQKMRSEEINLLAASLSVAQGAYLELECNRVNAFHKTEYSDNMAIFKATRKALEANGLSLINLIDIEETGELMVYAQLMHSSGQWISSKERVVPVVGDSSSTDSSIEVVKRRLNRSILGISGKQDFCDDDGVAYGSKAKTEFEQGISIAKDYKPVENEQLLSKDHIAELDYELSDSPDILKEIYKDLRVSSLSDIPERMYRRTISRVREIKALRSGIPKHRED